MRLGMVALIATEGQNPAALISSRTAGRDCQTEGEPSSTPACDSANASGVANFLQEQKNKQINPTNPTLNIPSHHFPFFRLLSASVWAENRFSFDS
jgi:hypothetical protein